MSFSLFIHSSSFSSFNHHHQTKNQHKQTCYRATLRLFSVKKIVVRMKNVKFRGEKTNSVPQFRGKNPNSAGALEIPRGGEKFRGARKTVGPTEKKPPPLYIYIYIYIYNIY